MALEVVFHRVLKECVAIVSRRRMPFHLPFWGSWVDRNREAEEVDPTLFPAPNRPGGVKGERRNTCAAMSLVGKIPKLGSSLSYRKREGRELLVCLMVSVLLGLT